MGSLNRFFGSIVQKYTEEDRGGRTTRRVVTRNVTQTTRGRRSVDCDRRKEQVGEKEEKRGREEREREGAQCLSGETAVTNSGLQPERGVER